MAQDAALSDARLTSDGALLEAVRVDPVGTVMRLRDTGRLSEDAAFDVLNRMSEQYPDLVRKKGFAERAFNAVNGAVRILANGMTLGAADSIAAGAETALGEGSFSENLQEQEAETDRFRDMSPTASLVGDITGGVMSAISLGRVFPGLAAGANPLARGLNVGQRIGRAATATGLGAVAGGTSGFFNTRGGLPERIGGAAGGGVVGGLTGLAAPVVIGALAAGGKRASSIIRNALGGPDSEAARRILQAFEADDITLEQAQARLRTLGSRAFMVDAGADNVAGLLRAAASQPGRARRMTERLLRGRVSGQRGPFSGETTQGQFDVLAQKLDELTGSEEAATTLAQLRNERSENAERLYLRAFQGADQDGLAIDTNGVLASIDNQLASLPESGIRRTALQNVRNMLTREVELDDGTTIRVPVTDLEVLHNVKREIDSMIDTRMSGDARLDGTVARDLVMLKNELLDVMTDPETGSPAYREALDTFAGDSAYINAIELGSNLFRQGRDAIDPAVVERMSESELLAFRLGAADAIIERLSRINDNSDATRNIFGNPQVRDVLSLAFGGDTRARREFEMAVLQEARFAATRNAAAPSVGSRTSLLDAERASLASGDPATPILQAAMGDLGGAAMSMGGNMVRNAVNRTQLVRPEVSDDIATMLMSGGEDAQRGLNRLMVDRVLNGVSVDNRLVPLIAGGVGGTQSSGSGVGPQSVNSLLEMLQ